MSFCYKLKFCKLWGKAGHNPYRCWHYSTIQKWIGRAEQLDSCVNCLTPWKLAGVVRDGSIMCGHCDQGFRGWEKYSKESQTEDIYLGQVC